MNKRCFSTRCGFTLIELLIVMLIISVLAGFTVKGISIAREKASIATTKTLISNIDRALMQYKTDYGFLPGRNVDVTDPNDPRSNVITEVYRALAENGRYLTLKENDLGIPAPNPQDDPLPATKSDIDDPNAEILIVDAWALSLIARENLSKEVKEPWMYRKNFMDVYSLGPNGVDDSLRQALEGEEGEDDDLGNW